MCTCTCRACVHRYHVSLNSTQTFLQLWYPRLDPCPLEHIKPSPAIQMLTSISRRLLPLRNYVQASSAIQRDTWTRNFQSTPRVEAADSMGKLIESGKEGAEFVVSGKLKKKKRKRNRTQIRKTMLATSVHDCLPWCFVHFCTKFNDVVICRRLILFYLFL